jgi:hypothetical protein
VELHHLRGPFKKPTMFANFLQEGTKNDKVLEARARTRDLALGARALELGYGLRAQASKANELGQMLAH